MIERMLPIMPSEQLIRHEWKKHGTCSGLKWREYFEKVEDSYALVTIPPPYKNPKECGVSCTSPIKERFCCCQSQLHRKNFAITCKGRFLSEVRVCFDKDLNPRACGSDIRDSCRVEKVILRPLR